MQIEEFQPDVVFLQDLSFFDAATLENLRRKYLLAGQCSCPMPKHENVSKFHILFTSFPHYVQRFKELGVQAEYLPLAFDPRMSMPELKRTFDISFVGGVGREAHWERGTDVLEAVAKEFKDRFVWYGYGAESLPGQSALRACYGGPAWGRDMYGVYARSKISVNRHGEVAEGYSNNLRMFEATGMGAVLHTEHAPNLHSLFPEPLVWAYKTPKELVDNIWFDLLNHDLTASYGQAVQQHTLTHHTYAHRMPIVSAILKSAKVPA